MDKWFSALFGLLQSPGSWPETHRVMPQQITVTGAESNCLREWDRGMGQVWNPGFQLALLLTICPSVLLLQLSAVLLPPKWECGIMHCSVIPAVNPQDSDGASVSLCLMELPAFEGTISREQGRWLQGFWPLALSGDLVPLCLPGYCSHPWTLWSWQIAFTTSRRCWQGGFFGCRKCEEIESKHIKLFLSILNRHLDVQSAL